MLSAPRSLVAVAIGNLLRNACTDTEQGQIRVTLGPSEVRVGDTGPGIPAEELDCLFADHLGCIRSVREEGLACRS